jgi:hypothetical protein
MLHNLVSVMVVAGVVVCGMGVLVVVAFHNKDKAYYRMEFVFYICYNI